MPPFRVLFVCTANFCRSPIAEQLLAAVCDRKFGAADTWAVESAGTNAEPDRSMHPFSEQVLIERNAFVAGHRTRTLTTTMLRDADVILTAAREHRAKVVRLLPGAIGRAFTILQFARLASAVEPIEADRAAEFGRRLLVEAKAARAGLQPVPPDQDDLPDPMGGPIEDFQVCAESLTRAISGIMRPLGPAGRVLE